MMNIHAPVRLVVIGAGITGLTSAYRILQLTSHISYSGPPVEVTVVESSQQVGGKIRTSPFAGFPGIDEGPDSYLVRVPDAAELARELGLMDQLTHPASAHAAIMHGSLHPIPEGLMLGVPTGVMSLAASSLLSRRGKLRAAIEPILPSSGSHGDSIGTFIRQRFGKEVQQLLVDPLVGSIYAADTAQFSLAMVPQLAELSTARSALLTARKRKVAAGETNSAIFETPIHGLASLTDALRLSIQASGGKILLGSTVQKILRRDGMYIIEITGDHTGDLRSEAIIVASPAKASAHFFQFIAPPVGQTLSMADHASVVMVTLRTAQTNLSKFSSMSGYLIPKSDQDRVTAVSFGSNKWSHWKPQDGSMIMRVSLGRDGVMTDDLIHEWDDARLVQQVVDEVSRHIGTSITPGESRVTRWPDSFPQYRPGHRSRMSTMETSLHKNAPGVIVAGASIGGIGIAACVAQGNTAAQTTLTFLAETKSP